ncbi:hypothetical protein EKO04_008877 [Ascochyta lentis]|uniref:Phytochrome n=1 Tax=Ascochyta lentis TaxID=205686 RepID=A0A8H7MHH2_9PLEO|nr:hypothetical protein EKO04_008877 [Ascochyta lentis]
MPSGDPPPHLAFLTQSTGDSAIDADLEYICNLNWDDSGVGPISSWPRELLTLINLAILSPQPQLFLLGQDSILLYNTAYGRLLHDHHPLYQGRPIGLNTALIAQKQAIDSIIESATTRSKPANEVHVPFFFYNQGQLEEVFLSATMVQLPLSLDGYHATTYETTTEVLQSRRDQLLHDLRHACETATDLNQLWPSLCDGISKGDKDLAFSVLYHAGPKILDEEDIDHVYPQVETQVFRLANTVGNFPMLPQAKLESTSDQAWIRKVFKSVDSGVLELLQAEDASLPEEMCKASKFRCYGDECRTAIVLPTVREQNTVPAVLILGLAPRRPYDEAYQAWIRSLHHVFAYHVARLSMAEAKARVRANDEKRAAREQEILAKELSLKRQEAAAATGKVRRMLHIMQAASVGVFECALSGEATYNNEAFCYLSGYSEHCDLKLTLRIHDLCEPEDKSILDTHWKELVAGQPATFSIRFRSLGRKQHHWVQIACVPIFDNSATVIGVSGYAINIDAQKEIEQEEINKRTMALQQLHLTEARLLNFIENAPLGILIMEQDGRPSFVNNTWFQLTGHMAMPTHDVDIRSVVFPEDVPGLDKCLEDVSLSGKSVICQVRLKRLWTGGIKSVSKPVWVQFTAYPEVVCGGQSRITTTMTDISGFKFSEALYHGRLKEALEARRQQESFVDMTSHEIRNPLSAVVHSTEALSQLLQETKSLLVQTSADALTNRLSELNRDMSDLVDTIFSCSMHQKRITDDILALSKLNSDLLEISPTVFHVETFIREVEKTFKVPATQIGIEFAVLPDLSLTSLGIDWIKADPGRIRQVLVNLITNAIKFTREETGTRNIAVRIGVSSSLPHRVFHNLTVVEDEVPPPTINEVVSADDVYLWCSVKDTGCGMDTAGRMRIFSRFTQASPKTYNKYGGSGLGLVVSRKLVVLQGGQIGFTSEIGAGSIFVFSVKACRASNPNLSTGPSTEPSKTISEKAPLPAAGQNQTAQAQAQLRILLVEDNLVNQKVLSKQLKRQGHTVHTSDNGQEAFNFIKTTQHWKDGANPSEAPPAIDVILMDIEMPVLNGFECTSLIREAERDGSINKHLPIIAVTANARPEQLKQVLESGMDDAVTKPFQMKDLARVFERMGIP